jgi:hypothetical protein
MKRLKKLFIVCWGSAGQDDDGNSKAFCGVHGVYTDKPAARKGLVECKDVCYDEVIQTDDPEELEYNKSRTKVYGSEAEEYFEIDYDFADVTNELYIKIDEVNLED